jgi:hypothetical protein
MLFIWVWICRLIGKRPGGGRRAGLRAFRGVVFGVQRYLALCEFLFGFSKKSLLTHSFRALDTLSFRHIPYLYYIFKDTLG